MSQHKVYHENIPVYLHNRPKKFVQHCIQRTGELKENEILRLEDNGHFRVRTYLVDTTCPSCQCEDFRKTGWPCKHILALLSYDFITWNDLPAEYVNLPCFNLDDMDPIDEECNEEIDTGE